MQGCHLYRASLEVHRCYLPEFPALRRSPKFALLGTTFRSSEVTAFLAKWAVLHIVLLEYWIFWNFAMGALYRFIFCHTNTYKGHTFIENNLNHFLFKLMKCTSSKLREFWMYGPRLMMWISHRVTSPWDNVIASFLKKKKKSNFPFVSSVFFANPLFFGLGVTLTSSGLAKRIHTLIAFSFFNFILPKEQAWLSFKLFQHILSEWPVWIVSN